MTAKRLAAMQRGRELRAARIRQEAAERVTAYREWLRLDAAYYALRRAGDLTRDQYRELRPPMPVVPRDSDYAALAS